MLNMLIIDDEPIIADGLRKFTETHYGDIFYIHCVYTVREALSLSRRLRLDLVLSDVLMPEMDGFQLQEQIQQTWRYCQFIFLSAHDDFAYIRKAMQNGSVSYILKTDDDTEILAAIEKALKRYKASIRIQTLLDDARRERRQALPWMQNHFFLELLHGHLTDAQEIQKSLQMLEIGLEVSKPVLPVMIEMEESTSLSQLSESALFACRALCSRLFEEIRHAVFQLTLTQQFILFQGNGDDEIVVRNSLEQFQGLLLEQFGLKSVVAVGNAAVPLINTDIAYYSLQTAIRNRGDYGAVLLCDSTRSDDCLKIERGFEALQTALDRRNPAAFFQGFYTLIDILSALQNNAERVTGILRLLTMAGNVCQDMKIMSGVYNTDFLHSIETLAASGTELRQCASSLENVFREYFILSGQEDKNRNSKMIADLHAYIETHLGEDLSMTRLGEVVAYNPSYLSTLYKKCTGKSLVDYVNHVRIERAKEWLLRSNTRIRQIALDCGFESQQYFNRIFKQVTGITPNEYRMGQ